VYKWHICFKIRNNGPIYNDWPDWKCGRFFLIFFAMDLSIDTSLVRRTIVDFIRNETRNAGFGRAVVGVSGGVDSAVSVTLAAEALGKENVLGVSMPYSTSSPASAADAAALLKQIGVKMETVDISPMVDAFIARDPGMDRLRRGNLMARARMIVLYDISARDRSIVVGTSNKTEILLGYGTLFGDTACGINPVGDLYKSQVWELAVAIGVPRAIVEKKPTADLWAGQTDEEELGFSYALADSLLFRMVDEGRGDDELASMGFAKELVGKVRDRIRANEFKRRPPLIGAVPRRAGKAGSPDPMDWGI
jgi:NAD+ synthase